MLDSVLKGRLSIHFSFSSHYIRPFITSKVARKKGSLNSLRIGYFGFTITQLRLLAQDTAFVQYTATSDFEYSIYVKFLATGTCLLMLELNSHEIQRMLLPNYISCSIVGDLNELIQRMPLIQCTLQLRPFDYAPVPSNNSYVSDMLIGILSFYNRVSYFKIRQQVCSVDSSGYYLQTAHNGSNPSPLYFYMPGVSLY